MTRDDLLAFEDEMAAAFNRGEIRAPLHLAGGNEAELISYFQDIKPNDWVLCGWRSHYHCLLKGVPKDQLRDAILRGRSISLCFPEYRVLSSGIVGGIASIGVGLSMAIKRARGRDRVHVFLGDMTAKAGISLEAMRYTAGHDLPVHWIVEDNGLSVLTDTQDAWGHGGGLPNIWKYKYKLTRPHVGTGTWVKF